MTEQANDETQAQNPLGDNENTFPKQTEENAKTGTEVENPDISMFYDVNMSLVVEIGRTQIKLRDLLNLTRGSVIELNKMAGEKLDILANGKLIAYGEVVSVNGKYGIRISSVATKSERAKQLSEG